MELMSRIQQSHKTVDEKCTAMGLPTDDHAHRCPNTTCGFVWKHGPLFQANISFIEHEDAHSCPKCGVQQFMKAPASDLKALLAGASVSASGSLSTL